MEKKRGDFVMSEEKFEENSTSQDYAAPQDYSAPDMSYSNAGSQAETPVTPVTENDRRQRAGRTRADGSSHSSRSSRTRAVSRIREISRAREIIRDSRILPVREAHRIITPRRAQVQTDGSSSIPIHRHSSRNRSRARDSRSRP